MNITRKAITALKKHTDISHHFKGTSTLIYIWYRPNIFGAEAGLTEWFYEVGSVGEHRTEVKVTSPTEAWEKYKQLVQKIKSL
jgi:hypothetical protein